MGRRSLHGLAVVGVVATAAVLFAVLRPGADHGAAPTTGRTVLVATEGIALPKTSFYALRDCLGNPTTCINGAEGIVLTHHVSGAMPEMSVSGTVLSDENCEPDRYGVSHCINRIELPAGRRLSVRHDHNMGNDPCLSPGEKVVVRSI